MAPSVRGDAEEHRGQGEAGNRKTFGKVSTATVANTSASIIGQLSWCVYSSVLRYHEYCQEWCSNNVLWLLFKGKYMARTEVKRIQEHKTQPAANTDRSFIHNIKAINTT